MPGFFRASLAPPPHDAFKCRKRCIKRVEERYLYSGLPCSCNSEMPPQPTRFHFSASHCSPLSDSGKEQTAAVVSLTYAPSKTAQQPNSPVWNEAWTIMEEGLDILAGLTIARWNTMPKKTRLEHRFTVRIGASATQVILISLIPIYASCALATNPYNFLFWHLNADANSFTFVIFRSFLTIPR
jgi:hypothetical protein